MLAMPVVAAETAFELNQKLGFYRDYDFDDYSRDYSRYSRDSPDRYTTYSTDRGDLELGESRAYRVGDRLFDIALISLGRNEAEFIIDDEETGRMREGSVRKIDDEGEIKLLDIQDYVAYFELKSYDRRYTYNYFDGDYNLGRSRNYDDYYGNYYDNPFRSPLQVGSLFLSSVNNPYADFLDIFNPIYIVVGDDAPSTDVIAGVSVGLGIAEAFPHKKIESKLASEVNNLRGIISVGNSCNNPVTARLTGTVCTTEQKTPYIQVLSGAVVVSGSDPRIAGEYIRDWRTQDISSARINVCSEDPELCGLSTSSTSASTSTGTTTYDPIISPNYSPYLLQRLRRNIANREYLPY